MRLTSTWAGWSLRSGSLGSLFSAAVDPHPAPLRGSCEGSGSDSGEGARTVSSLASLAEVLPLCVKDSSMTDNTLLSFVSDLRGW